MTDTSAAATALGGAGEHGTGENGNGGGTDTFLAGLSEEHRAIATENGWNDAGAMFEGIKSLKATADGALTLPGEDATPEQRSEFFDKVSPSLVPKDGYTFNMPEGLPENFPYDQEFAKEAGDWFKEAGLPPKVAQVLHDKWVAKMAGIHGQSVEAAAAAEQKQAEAVENAHRELVKEFGEPGTEGYSNLVAKADRAMNGLKEADIDVSSWFAEKGILTEAGEDGAQQVADPVAVKLLAFIHDKAMTEDGLSGLGDGMGGKNPFDPSNPNITKQSELVRNQPDVARRLIANAGLKAADFNL